MILISKFFEFGGFFVKTAFIKDYIYNNGKIIMRMEKKEIHLDEKITIQLKERHSGKKISYAPNVNISKDDVELSLSLSNIKFNEFERMILDIFIYDGIDYKRCKLQNPAKISKSMRHSNMSFSIDDSREAIPYITDDGSVAIIYGESIRLWNEIFEYEKNNLTVSEFIIEDKRIHLKIKADDIGKSEHMFIIAQSRKNKDICNLKIKNISKKNNDFCIEIDTTNQYIDKERYDLKLIQKTGRLVTEYRLGMRTNLFGNQNKNFYFDIIKVAENTFIRPYLTLNGGVSLHSNNRFLLQSEVFEITNKVKGFFHNYKFEKNKLIFFLVDDVSKRFELFKNNELWIECNNIYYSFSVNKEMLQRGFVEIDLDEEVFKYSTQDANKISFNVFLTSSFLDIKKNEDTYLKYFDESAKEKSDLIFEITQLYSSSNWKGTKKEQFPIINIDKNNEIIFLQINNTAKMKIIKVTKEEYEKLIIQTKKVAYDICNLKQDNHKLTFTLLTEFSNASNISFYCVERKTKQEIPLKFIDFGNNEFQLDLMEIIKVIGVSASRWDVYVCTESNDTKFVGKIGLFRNSILDKKDRYLNTIELNTIDNYLDHVMIPFLTNNNGLSVVIRDKKFVYNEKYEINSEIKDIKLKKDKMTCEFILNVNSSVNFKISKVMMKLRSKISEEEYYLDVIYKKINANKVAASFIVDLSKIDFNQFYYDFFVVSEIKDDTVYTRLENCSNKLKNKINKSIFRYHYYKDNAVVYPYITDKNVLFLAYRQMSPEESKLDKVKELIAFATYKTFRSYFDNKKIWLVYEKNSEMAQDNSFYFFKYSYFNQPEKNIYYVIKKNSPDLVYLEEMKDKVVYFMSIKHLIYVLSAKLLVSSETRGHLFTWRHQIGRVKNVLNKKQFVFLQHGVTALKLNDSILSKKSGSAANMYVTSSEFEKNIIMNGLGYKKNDIIVSGFPRWDVLEDKSDKISRKEIFMMPTWRGWLDEVDEEKFIETPYFKYYMEILNSDKLKSLLKQSNIQFNFFLHPKFKQYIKYFSSDSDDIRLIEFGEEKVNELLMNSSLLITDYSSVAWEMYYMAKPVIFYQFDYEEYNRLTGSYINMEDGLFGERMFNAEELITGIEAYILNNFEEKEEYALQRKNYFKYIDNNNSKRVYEGIMKSKVLKNIK